MIGALLSGGWVKLLSGAMTLVNALVKAMERRQLIDQGRVQQVAEGNAEILESVRKAAAARRAVPEYLAGDKLPDDDPDRRD
jgi:hypothetical protein